MKKLACLLLWFVLMAESVSAADAPELTRLRENYKAALERATKPVTQAYIAELQKLRDTYTKAANLEAATQADAELKGLAAELPAASISIPGAKGASTVITDAPVIIPANEPNGYRIGPVKRGDVITLSYVKGQWKDEGHVPSVNPDAAVVEKGEKSRLVIAKAVEKNLPGAIITVVRPGTATSPFVYTFQTDHEDVVLRIHSNSQNKSNPGSVTYNVKLTR